MKKTKVKPEDDDKKLTAGIQTQGAEDPLLGILAPSPEQGGFLDSLAKRVKEFIFEGPLPERSYTPGGKDERAHQFCMAQEEMNGSKIFGAASRIALQLRISLGGEKRGIGRQDAVQIATAEQIRQIELEKVRLMQQREQQMMSERR